MTWYQVSRWGVKITPVEITSTTDKFVVLANGRREAKISQYYCYFETWQKAYAYIHARAVAVLNTARAELVRAENELREIESLREVAP